MVKLSIQYAGKTIECEVIYSRRKTMSIEVKPDATVIVKSPKLIPSVILKKFIHKKASWIHNKVRYIKTHKTKKEQKKYIEGEIHHFLGAEYPLRIRKGSKDHVMQEQDGIYITTDRVSPIIIKSLLRRWYHDQGVKLIHERYRAACAVFRQEKIVPALFSYKRMKGKWGTCSHDNKVCFNPDLIKTPIDCIDYVIYHELCHVRHHNHGRGFHRLMLRMMPDWKKRKKLLDQYSIE